MCRRKNSIENKIFKSTNEKETKVNIILHLIKSYVGN